MPELWRLHSYNLVMLCLSFRAVRTKFSEGDWLPCLTGCPLKISSRVVRLFRLSHLRLHNNNANSTFEDETSSYKDTTIVMAEQSLEDQVRTLQARLDAQFLA
jgi:hypothetical protein